MNAKLKGKMLIGQSGGPTAVINQSLIGAIIAAKSQENITGILGAKHGIQGIMDEDFIDLSAYELAKLERIAITPAAALGSVRLKPGKAECVRVFEVFKKHDIRYFFYIGGNDSAETAHIISEMAKEAQYDFCTVHIPKTIDNDLKVTDHCPGFASAAKFVAQAFMGDDRDNRALKGIKVNVVMGRHAGFLTAASALARQGDESRGPHLIYMPERAFDRAQFQQDVRQVHAKWGRCVIAVSEGISDTEGTPILSSNEKDSHGNVQLSGTGALGDYLSALIKDAFSEPMRVRADTFGYLQRSFPGVISEVDAQEARMVGTYGVEQAVQQASSGSVAIRRLSDKPYESDCFMTPLSSVARESTEMKDAWIHENGHDITEDFLTYLTPLVGELPIVDEF
ncbi:MAG: 6-phosphofructokinase [Mariprofundaceae bacterium]|nr:6-phosphofructokinase [Mariprofundaceae bacterium]